MSRRWLVPGPEPQAPEAASLEWQLLLACAWKAPEPQRAWQEARIQALAEAGPDWQGFLDLVQRHRSAALVLAVMPESVRARMPAAIRSQAVLLASRISAAALGCAAELLRVRQAFAEQGIANRPLKGSLLSQRLYGAPALRAMSDLDLLVAAEDLARAESVLLSLGYQGQLSWQALNARSRRVILGKDHDLGFSHPESGLRLELHWRPAFWSPVQVARLWADPVAQPWLGSMVEDLSEDALLCYLLDHGAKHQYFKLKWLSDVATLMAGERRRPWSDLFRLAKDLDCQPSLAQAAVLVQTLFGLELAEPVQAFLRERKEPAWLSAKVLQALTEGPRDLFERPALRDRMADFRYLVHLRERVSVWAYARSLMLSGPGHEALHRNGRWLWVHYGCYLVGWVRRHARVRSGR